MYLIYVTLKFFAVVTNLSALGFSSAIGSGLVISALDSACWTWFACSILFLLESGLDCVG